MKSRDVVFQENQTLGDFDKANQSKGTSDDFIELVPIPPSLEQPKNEEEIDELQRDDSASDISLQKNRFLVTNLWSRPQNIVTKDIILSRPG